jgi:hypothetical protein
MGGQQSTGTAHLSFPEDERQNGNVEIDGRDTQYAPAVWANIFLHAAQYFRRVELPAFAVERKIRIQAIWQYFAGHADGIREIRA